MKRFETNILICANLINYFTANPEIRFTQALFNLGINEFEKPHYIFGDGTKKNNLKDKYNEESIDTLKNLKNGKII